MEAEQALALDQKIQAFLNHPTKCIFVIFFGVVNHWITIVIYNHFIFVLDSENIQHMNRHEEDLPVMTLEADVWKEIRVGIEPPTDKFECQMSIQSMFD